MAVVFIILAVIGWSAEGLGCILAQTESGLVCGVRKVDAQGGAFVSFLGVPYARAPVGNLRFAEPQPREPFEAIFNAMAPGPDCPQETTNFTHPQSEDCLRANIHTPLAVIPDLDSKESRSLLPVLVFIHGGSFIRGTGHPDFAGAEYLITKDILVVTLQYRIGSLGFLSLNSDYIPGNAGLKDVFFGLQWVQRNIRNFGGDPDQVTLAGQSAGAGLAQLIALSPASKEKRLFKRVYLTSLSVLSPIFNYSPSTAKHVSNLFLWGMGINPLLSPKRIYQEIINAPVEKILEADQFVRKRAPALSFTPVLETTREGSTNILPDAPEKLMKSGNGKEYPMLIGFASNECFPYTKIGSALLLPIQKLPFLVVPPKLIESNYLAVPVMSDLIMREYFNGAFTDSGFENYCTDLLWKYPTMQTVDVRLSTKAEPTYVYEFGLESDDEEASKYRKYLGLPWKWRGAIHGEDLVYLFRLNRVLDAVGLEELSQNNIHSKIIDFMTSSVANFVKFGRPSVEPSVWPPIGCDYVLMNVNSSEPQASPAAPSTMKMKKFFDILYDIGHSDNYHIAKSKICNDY